MARVKLKLPEKFEFSTEIRVRISDINYGNHLGNDSFLSLMHEARLRYLKKNGYSEADIDGASLIMSDAVIVYKAQVFYEDVLQIEVTADNFTAYSFDFIYRIAKKETGQEAARAKTGIAFLDKGSGKITPVPEKFKSIFA